MDNAFDILMERGFIEQMTHQEEIRKLLENEKVTFYIGFDPTADSLHIGHFITVMAMAHMQRAGHRPIALCGGGTGMIGDPTDKSDMRKMMTKETIDHNVNCFKKQLSRFIDFSDDKAIMGNNADWILDLNYMDFLREYGIHFSVNRMLATDAYKKRFERGLTFFEFNYMILQSYDFLELNRRYNCKIQFGGNDQWSNIISGADLIRRVEGTDAYGMTFKLLTTSDGHKMGKTMSGAIWLDPEKTTPYEFYQYWRNIDDADVGKCLALLTFLPMEEVNKLSTLQGSEINRAKEILAFEVTKIVHGEDEANKSKKASEALFAGGANLDNVPTTEVYKTDLQEGISIIELLEKSKLISSRSEGRRLIQQNGISIDGNKISDFNHIIRKEDFKDNSLLIQKGKKVFHRIVLMQ